MHTGARTRASVGVRKAHTHAGEHVSVHQRKSHVAARVLGHVPTPVDANAAAEVNWPELEASKPIEPIHGATVQAALGCAVQRGAQIPH